MHDDADCSVNSNNLVFGELPEEIEEDKKPPIEIGEGCVMECRECYLVLSPDGAATSSGFSSRSCWSFAGTSMIALLLAIIGLL